MDSHELLGDVGRSERSELFTQANLPNTLRHCW